MVKSIEKGGPGDDLRVSYASDLAVSGPFRADPLIRDQLVEAGFLRALTPKLPKFTASLREARKSYPPGLLPIVLPSERPFLLNLQWPSTLHISVVRC